MAHLRRCHPRGNGEAPVYHTDLILDDSTRRYYGKKKRFNLQAPPVYDRKVTNLFFSIIIVSIFFFHNSVGDCMSIDSQFECILRGNIEL